MSDIVYLILGNTFSVCVSPGHRFADAAKPAELV